MDPNEKTAPGPWRHFRKLSPERSRYVADCEYRDIMGYQNGESVALYCVYPFRLLGANSTLGRNTYLRRRFQNPACSMEQSPKLPGATWNCALPSLGGGGADVGGGPSVSEWQQTVQSALLGMRDEAAMQVLQRAAWGMNVSAPNSIGLPGATDHGERITPVWT